MILAVLFSSLQQASSAPSLEQGKEPKFVSESIYQALFQRYSLSGIGSGGGGGPPGSGAPNSFLKQLKNAFSCMNTYKQKKKCPYRKGVHLNVFWLASNTLL